MSLVELQYSRRRRRDVNVITRILGRLSDQIGLSNV